MQEPVRLEACKLLLRQCRTVSLFLFPHSLFLFKKKGPPKNEKAFIIALKNLLHFFKLHIICFICIFCSGVSTGFRICACILLCGINFLTGVIPGII